MKKKNDSPVLWHEDSKSNEDMDRRLGRALGSESPQVIHAWGLGNLLVVDEHLIAYMLNTSI